MSGFLWILLFRLRILHFFFEDFTLVSTFAFVLFVVTRRNEKRPYVSPVLDRFWANLPARFFDSWAVAGQPESSGCKWPTSYGGHLVYDASRRGSAAERSPAK